MVLNHCYGEDTMRHPILTAALAGTVALTMVGCSTNKDDQSASGDKSDKPVIVASTNVWGSVAQAVGGDQAEVKSVITKPTQDPHDYEATAQDKLAFSKASIAIVNGGGYDDWATTLAKSSDSKPTLIDAVTASGLKTTDDADHDEDTDHEEHGDHDADHEGHHHHHGEFNEHVFYSIDTALKVSKVIETQLSKADPDHANDYEANADEFAGQLKDLDKKADSFTDSHKDVHALATEPVAGYLLQDMGIEDSTPEEFVTQSETDAGPSTKTVADTKALLSGKKVQLLVVNGQTTDAITDQLRSTAKTAGIPEVGVTETLPEGVDTYADFIGSTIDKISTTVK